jgi:oligopeptide transport system ATP-binding protein
MTVGSIIGEPLDEHTALSRRRRERIYELMDAVGLNRGFRQPLSA